MAVNTIQLAQRYKTVLDLVYKNASLTGALDMNSQFIQSTDNEKTILIPEMSLDGLANYDRNNGFVSGAINGSWRPYTLQMERGRSFTFDRMDNVESLGVFMGSATSEFVRTHVVPEVDAARFARYATQAGFNVSAELTTADSVIQAIDTANAAMDDAEVPIEGRIIYMTPSIYMMLKQSTTYITRFAPVPAPAGQIDRNFESFDGMMVIRVPESRFNTQITLNDGVTTGQTGGGYTTSGDTINFMIVHPSAVTQLVKLANLRIWTPDQYQTKDSWAFDYRLYHDAWVMYNKKNGVYAHVSTDTPTIED
jgi:hypothetical protein